MINRSLFYKLVFLKLTFEGFLEPSNHGNLFFNKNWLNQCSTCRIDRESIFTNQNNKKFPMKKSVSVQTMFKLTNNLKTITKQKILTQRQSNGEPEQEIPGKFRLHFCKFHRKPIKTNNFIEWFEKEIRFPIRIELAGSKNAEKNDLSSVI